MVRVSVVVPVFNVERYVSECLENLVSQTLRDIEIICVNDGSTDGSRAVLSRFAQRDDRIRIIDQANGGISSARNTGVAVARGEYLYFQDSDDFIDLDTLEQLYERAAADGLDVLYFNAAAFFEDAAMEAAYPAYLTYYLRNHDYPGVRTGAALAADMRENWEHRPSVALQFIRADYYREAGLSFYEGILHEDNLFSFLCAFQASRAGYVAQQYYHRRVRKDSIMTRPKRAVNFDGYLVSYLEMLRFSMQHEFDARISRWVAVLIADIHEQAVSVYCALSSEERSALTAPDSSVEAFLVLDLITREANARMRALTD